MNEKIQKMISNFHIADDMKDAVMSYSIALINQVVQLHNEGTDVFAYYGIENNSNDTVSIELDLSDSELLQYMCMAHSRDITFNRLVVDALQAAMDAVDLDDSKSQ